MIIAVFVDRLVLFLLVLLIAPLIGIDHPFFSLGVLIAGLPGIILQLLTVPTAVYLIENKYPQWKPLR
jgi:hypothetical protein